MDNRQHLLKQCKHCLNSPDGEVLIEEIHAIVTDGGTLLGDTPQETAYRVGAYEVYQAVLALKSGELIDE